MNPPDDDALDRALAQLPRVAPPALHARVVRERAEAALGARRVVSRAMRAEPAVLVALALAHLGWALVRVYAFR